MTERAATAPPQSGGGRLRLRPLRLWAGAGKALLGTDIDALSGQVVGAGDVATLKPLAGWPADAWLARAVA